MLLVDHGDTVTTAAHCCYTGKVRVGHCCKRLGLLHQDIITVHDNATPHATNNTVTSYGTKAGSYRPPYLQPQSYTL
jgi:hypothetical protein